MAALSEGTTEAINKMVSESQDDWWRDQFALAALRMFSMGDEGCKLLQSTTQWPQHELVAKFCWDVADAMMKEREKRYVKVGAVPAVGGRMGEVMAGSVYEVTITAEFVTGCTGSSLESAAKGAQDLLIEELKRAQIATDESGGLFRVRVIDVKAEDLKSSG